jgi:hypothetical protein
MQPVPGIEQLRALAAHLDKLVADAQPLWGQFTAQHMLEHLMGTLIISNGRVRLPAADTPESEWPSRKGFLFNDLPFPKGVVNARVTKGELRFADLDAARAKFWEAFGLYETFWTEQPNEILMHPLFGPLTGGEWLRFHEKHMGHHLRQFGLLPEVG